MTINRDLADLVPTLKESGGNIGVNTTTPLTKLNVQIATPGTTIGTNVHQWISDTNGSVSSLDQLGFGFGVSGTNTIPPVIVGSICTSSSGVTKGGFFVATRDVTTDTAPTERMRVNPDGTIKTSSTISVGAATPSTSGAGITFPATQSASSDANTLDDYEEGNWTPTFQGAGTAGTYTLSGTEARYTKVGRMVTLYATFGFSAASGGSAYARVDGIPFPIDTVNFGVAMFSTVDLDAACIQVCTARVSPGTNSSLFFSQLRDNVVDLELPVASFTTSSTVYFTFTYFVS